MAALPASAMAAIMRRARAGGDEFMVQCFGAFDFEGIVHTPPTRTFAGELVLSVGDKQIHLIEVGPAHTGGDILVFVPSDNTVYTGDILFVGGTPPIWACELILAMDVATRPRLTRRPARLPSGAPLPRRARARSAL